jgi:hypothetical protein
LLSRDERRPDKRRPKRAGPLATCAASNLLVDEKVSETVCAQPGGKHIGMGI